MRLRNRNRKSEKRKSRAFGLCVSWGGSACSKTGLRSPLHTLIRSQPVCFSGKAERHDTIIINDGQRYGDEPLAEPDGLFDPEGHGPISFDGMAAYKAFLVGFPQS